LIFSVHAELVEACFASFRILLGYSLCSRDQSLIQNNVNTVETSSEMVMPLKGKEKGSDPHVSTFLVSLSISRRIRSSSAMRSFNLRIDGPSLLHEVEKQQAPSSLAIAPM